MARYDLHSIGATVVNPKWAEPRFVDRAADDYRLYDVVAGLRFTSPDLDASNVLLDQAVPPHYLNLINNSGFETGLNGWTVNNGGAIKTGSPSAYEGSQYFNAGNIEQGFAEQSINLLTAGFTVQQIDSGLLDLAFGGRVRAAAEAPRDAGSVSLIFLDAAGNELRRQDVEALNTADRWELVGARVTAPVGARFAVLRFAADRNSGSSDDVWFDTGFVYQVADSYVANLGAYGAGTHEPATTTAPRIELRFPDMYTDWEKNEPVAIRWETLNNLANSPVRIDLLQDTADGPRLVTNIVASTPDDGNFIWIPANSGIDFGTKGLRIQVSLVNAPAVIDRSQETFSVPEDGQNYYVDDQSNVGDAYTPGAVGDNRNTGKTAATPKPNPVNVFRAYDLKAGDTLYIDTGDYPMIDPIAVSGTVDVSLVAGPGMGRDEGFTITGPADTSLIAKLFPAIPRPQPGFDRLERRRLRQRQPFDLAKCPARPVRSRRLRQFQRQLPDRQRPRPAGYFYRHRLAVRRSGPSGQLQQPGRRRRGQRQHPRADQFRGLCQYRRRFQRQRRYRNGQRKHRLQQQRLGLRVQPTGRGGHRP